MGLASDDDRVEQALARKRARAYPEGWFQACYADEIAPGEVKRLHYFGRELALFRTESGVPRIVDAYCAHLGAHLAVGGAVKGERLVCPFHGWEYGVDGKCEHIPYSAKAPPRGAEVDAWPTEESAGIVFFWHSPIGRAPLWAAPSLGEYGADGFGVDYIRQRYRVKTTCHEIAENIFDGPHTVTVHGAAAVPAVTYEADGPRFRAEFQNELPSVGGKAVNVAICHGLGAIENHGRGHGDKSSLSCYTPVDRDSVDVWFSLLPRLASPNDPTGEISRRSAHATYREFEKDIPIWEAKLYRHTPLLVREDGPIGRYRTWARQFFPAGDAHDGPGAPDAPVERIAEAVS